MGDSIADHLERLVKVVAVQVNFLLNDVAVQVQSASIDISVQTEPLVNDFAVQVNLNSQRMSRLRQSMGPEFLTVMNM